MNPLDARLGVSVMRSRRAEIGTYLFVGSLGIVVHPVDYEKLLDGCIDDWEALRRSVARSFDERWRWQFRDGNWKKRWYLP